MRFPIARLSSQIAGQRLRSSPKYGIICRFITERSFADEMLKANGVKLDPAPKEPIQVVTQEVFDNPTDKVKKLVDQVLDLNVLEIAQFFKLFKVTFKNLSHIFKNHAFLGQVRGYRRYVHASSRGWGACRRS
jgi:hypothetical protein